MNNQYKLAQIERKLKDLQIRHKDAIREIEYILLELGDIDNDSDIPKTASYELDNTTYNDQPVKFNKVIN